MMYQILKEMPSKQRELIWLSDQLQTSSDPDMKVRFDELRSEIASAYQIVMKMPTSEYRELLSIRYFSKRPARWRDVAAMMGYSFSHVRGVMHRNALAEAEAIWRREGQSG